jgi:hypothetical protein
MTEYSRMTDPQSVKSGAADAQSAAERLTSLMTSIGAEINDDSRWAGNDDTGNAYHGEFDKSAKEYFPAGEKVGRTLQNAFKGVGGVAVTKTNVDDVAGEGVSKSESHLPNVRT